MFLMLKNLLYAFLLNQNGFTLVLGSNKIIRSYIGKSYLLINDLYNLSIIHFSNTALYFSSSYVTNVECCDLWHDRHLKKVCI
jgi:hypothetical protein